MVHFKPSLAIFLAVICATGAAQALAGTVLFFPKDAPAFTFELPDSMQAEYQPDGKLVCTPKDGSSLRGVFQTLPGISNDKGALMGLNLAAHRLGPQFFTGNVQFPKTFGQDEPNGVHTTTASVFGLRDGKQSALAFIVFSKAGKYYELMVLGATDTMTALSFPHSFRQTVKLTP